MIKKALRRASEKLKARDWDRLYMAVDLHETVIKPTYNNKSIEDSEFYKNAKECLQYMSKRDDIVLIMYTCAHEDTTNQYLEFFKKHGINFDYVNENPEVPNTKYADFSKKFYRNVTLDDTAGFDPEIDFCNLLFILKLLYKHF